MTDSLLVCAHVMNCWTDPLIDFENRTEAMEIKCICSNAQGLNNHAQYSNISNSSM